MHIQLSIFSRVTRVFIYTVLYSPLPIFFHSFKQGNVPANRDMSQRAMGSTGMGSSAGKRTCSRAPCTKDAHGSCQNQCCKFCCVVTGGCSIKGHNEAALSQTQLSKLFTAVKRASSRTLPSPSPSSATPLHYAPLPHFLLDPRLTQPECSLPVASGDLSASESDPVLRMEREDEANLRKQQEEVEHEAELEHLEEEDYNKAVAESLSLILPISESTSLGPPASSSQSLPLASEPSTSLLVQGLPVTRVTGSNRPTITSHMSPDWMRAHEDRTKLPQAIRKGQVDSELIKRFRVIWWSKVRIYTVHFEYPLTLLIGWHKCSDDPCP
jgi:hypothetical protein